MRRLRHTAATFLLLSPALATGAHAQGTVSAQGLGYPPGQLSTWALSTGGAVAELDPASPLNPAAIGLAGTTTLFAHYAPESRTVSIGDTDADSRLSRFPLVGAVLPFGSRGYVGIAASTFLDRSWATTRLIMPDGAVSTTGGIVETFQSVGGITDIRGAGTWSFGPRFRLGVGAHVYTGENRLTVSRIDQDGVDADFEQRSSLTYTGLAGSAGLVWSPARTVSVGMSGRVGGRMRAKTADTLLATATAPSRGGATVRVSAITGAAISARAEWEGWSSLRGLGGEGFQPQDSWSYGVGADLDGPTILRAPVTLRVGAQWRELPFSALGEQPRETALSGGLGMPLARGRVSLDFGVQRASRTAGEARETAWTYGLGLTVRP